MAGWRQAGNFPPALPVLAGVSQMARQVHCFEVVEGQEWLLPTDGEDYERFFAMDGTVIRDWAPPTMALLTHREDGRPTTYSDFPWLGEHAPIFRARAVEQLGKIAEGYGQLLPLRGEEAWLYNVTNVLDALDQERARITYFDDGSILAVERYAFKAEAIQAAEIFKLPGRASPVFVTDQFVARVRDSGLAGVSFRSLAGLQNPE